jgi:hypothetical protein
MQRSFLFYYKKRTVMVLCLNDRNCVSGSRCLSGVCVYPNQDIRNSSLILPMVGAILYDTTSLRYIYLSIFICLASIGLISNIFSLITFMRDRIRYTVCGVYLILFALCGIVLMMVFLTNLIIAFRYDDYLSRLWACHGYPYVFQVMINTSILMSTVIVIENILNRYFGFDRFRSRKCALFISFNLFILVSITNLDKIFARRLISDQSGHFYCIYKHQSSSFWHYINNSTSYLYMIIPGIIHFIYIIFILFKIKQQKQKWDRYQDLLLPSFIILLCLCPYVIFRYVLDRCITYSNTSYIRLHIGFILILYIPQIFTFTIYVLPNKYYLEEFRRLWGSFCCCNRQPQIQEFAVIHRLCQGRTSLEAIMTIYSLNDGFVDTELYNKAKLEV